MTKDVPVLLYKPVFRVIAAWVWWFVGAVLTLLIILVLQGLPLLSISSAQKIMEEKGYLTVYMEIVSAGLLPLVFSLLCKENFTHYGIRRKGLTKSILFSLLFVAVMFGFSYLSRGALPGFILGLSVESLVCPVGNICLGPSGSLLCNLAYH